MPLVSPQESYQWIYTDIHRTACSTGKSKLRVILSMRGDKILMDMEVDLV